MAYDFKDTLDDDLIDQLTQGIFDEEEDLFDPKARGKKSLLNERAAAKLAAKLIGDDPGLYKREEGVGRAVKGRNWYEDFESDDEKSSKYGDISDPMDTDYLRDFYVNPENKEAEDYEGIDSLLEEFSPSEKKGPRSETEEEKSFRDRTAKAMKKFPNAGKGPKDVKVEKTYVKEPAKKKGGGVEVGKIKAEKKDKPLSNIPTDFEPLAPKRFVQPVPKGFLPSTKVPADIPMGESTKDLMYGEAKEETLPWDILEGLAGAGAVKSLMKGGAKIGSKLLGAGLKPVTAVESALPALGSAKAPVSSLRQKLLGAVEDNAPKLLEKGKTPNLPSRTRMLRDTGRISKDWRLGPQQLIAQLKKLGKSDQEIQKAVQKAYGSFKK